MKSMKDIKVLQGKAFNILALAKLNLKLIREPRTL